MGGLTSQDCSPVCMLRIQNNIAVLSRNRHSTTDIIEGLNQQYRKVTKTKSVFPSDTAMEKSCTWPEKSGEEMDPEIPQLGPGPETVNS